MLDIRLSALGITTKQVGCIKVEDSSRGIPSSVARMLAWAGLFSGVLRSTEVRAKSYDTQNLAPVIFSTTHTSNFNESCLHFSSYLLLTLDIHSLIQLVGRLAPGLFRLGRWIQSTALRPCGQASWHSPTRLFQRKMSTCLMWVDARLYRNQLQSDFPTHQDSVILIQVSLFIPEELQRVLFRNKEVPQ